MFALMHYRLQPFLLDPRRTRGDTKLIIAASEMRKAGLASRRAQVTHDLRHLSACLEGTSGTVEQHGVMPVRRRQHPEALVEKPVAGVQLHLKQLGLDARGRRDRQCECRPPVGSGQSGDVDRADDGTIDWIADHAGRAGPAVDAGTEMLGGMHLDGLPGFQGRADRVRPAGRLAPVAAG
jgi:hypothetical protein